MSTTLALPAPEQGTYAVSAAFTDESGASVVPDTMTWSLYSGSGLPINGRENVNIAALAAAVDILLTGADLNAEDGLSRYLLLKGTYTSALGAGLPLCDQVSFALDDFVGLSSSSGSSGPSELSALLLETGDKLLLETGDKLLLED